MQGTEEVHIKYSLNGIEGVAFRKAGQGREPETADGGTFKRVDVYCYHSESETGKVEKWAEMRKILWAEVGWENRSSRLDCCKDSVNREPVIHGIQPKVWLQVSCQMFIPAITVGRHRFQNAGGERWSSGERTSCSSGRWVLVPTLLMRGV